MTKSTNSEKANAVNSADKESKKPTTPVVRLTPSMSLRAIVQRTRAVSRVIDAERKASRAKQTITPAADAPKPDAAKRKQKAKPVRKPIDISIDNIRRAWAKNAPAGFVVQTIKPGRYESAVSILALYKEGMTPNYIREHNIHPHRMLAFYPAIHNHDRLGSISIYGEDMGSLYLQLAAVGNLYGIAFRSISLERGLRPFIDIKF